MEHRILGDGWKHADWGITGERPQCRDRRLSRTGRHLGWKLHSAARLACSQSQVQRFSPETSPSERSTEEGQGGGGTSLTCLPSLQQPKVRG